MPSQNQKSTTSHSMRPATQKAFTDIIEAFSSANMEFFNLMALLRQMDKQAAEGDKGAEQILDIMFKFHKLIQVANKPQHTTMKKN